jgi:aldose 1-epimerase
LPASTIDHAFAGFGGSATISGEGRMIALTSDAPFLHVFAPAGEDYFCLEPVSHLPGVFPGAERLKPGEALSLSMTVGRAAA